MARHDHAHRISVVHAAAPTCHWTWGYEPVFNRLRATYGDQIDLHVPVYMVQPSDKAGWLKEYGMTEEEVGPYMQEILETIGVPAHEDIDACFCDDNTPATLAVMAARRQGEDKGRRMLRELLRRVLVEKKDVVGEAALMEAAKAVGLDAARFRRDMEDKDLVQDIEAQGENVPPVHVGFYNVAVTDGHGRTVLLDHAFDPADVEDAIDWVSGGTLRKTPPTDVLAYLRHHGATPAVEVARVFGFDEKEAERRLTDLERQGKARSATLAGAPFWSPS